MGMVGMAGGAGAALAKAFIVSMVMAALMLLMALGFLYAFSPGAALPVSVSIVLVIFALSFVASAVLLGRSGAGQASSIIGGAAVALGLTVLLVTIGLGLYYLKSGMLDLDLETLLAGFAAAIVASVIINQLTVKI